MAGQLTLRVITPDAIVLDEQATYVAIPGTDGSIGILPRHAAMVAALDTGVLHYKQDGKDQTLFVNGGFAEVRGSTVRVVSEAGERSLEIDEERAQAAEKRALERLKQGQGSDDAEFDVLRAEAALRRAQYRLLAARGYSRSLA
jgi:F-type H+-transporting ATPase subunit epsilon